MYVPTIQIFSQQLKYLLQFFRFFGLFKLPAVRVASAFGSKYAIYTELKTSLILDVLKPLEDILKAVLGSSRLEFLKSLLGLQIYGNIQVSDRWVLHPDYKRSPLLNDIAIITLPETVQFSKTIEPVK